MITLKSLFHAATFRFQYVKLNVGGSLHYTTLGTLTKHDNMLRAMFSGRMEVLTDAEGWILIGKGQNYYVIQGVLDIRHCDVRYFSFTSLVILKSVT